MIGRFSYCLVFLILAQSVFAANYFVTQSGAGTNSGNSLGNASSVSQFNAGTQFTETGGDTVSFSGTITSTASPSRSGTANGASRLTLDFSGATLNTANPRVALNGRAYLNVNGGGSWTQTGSGGTSTYTAGCIVGAVATGNNIFSFGGNLNGHDVTVQGFQSTASASTDEGRFMSMDFCNNLTIQDNNLTNISCLVVGDTDFCHDAIIRRNYFNQCAGVNNQDDAISIGNAYNVTIELNKFILNAPGDGPSGRHNDGIQTYKGGGANPYGWIIRYNWFETTVSTGTGDNSFTQLEDMTDSGGTMACKIYGNIFFGTATATGPANGVLGSGSGCTYYHYNNTYFRGAGPGNISVFNNGGGAATLYSRNNIGTGTTNVATGLSWTCTAGATWDYNWFFNWNSPTSTYWGTHGASNTNPLLVDPTTFNFSLQSGSPCKGAADATIGAEFNQGIAANSSWPNPTLVSRGSSWDIGAFQVTAGAATFSSSLSGNVALTGNVKLQ